MSWTVLSLKNLTNALNKVDDWEGLGIQLDIEYNELQKIFKDRSTTEERKRAMLQFWLNNDPKPSWQTLCNSLEKMGLKRIAEEINTSTQCEDEPLQVATVTAQSVNDATADPPSTPPTDQPEQTLTPQSEHVTTVAPDPPSPPPIDQETTAMRVRKVQQEIATLVNKYDDLVAKTVESFCERQEDSPNFCRKLRISVAVLPTSLKYQHSYFLKHHSSQIAKATTVEEIFSILNSYWNFLNCSLLTHIISKFGDEELQRQLSSYMETLQAFRLRTKITDFFKAYTGTPNLPPEFVTLKTKMGSEWEQCTLEDAEELRRSMATNSSTTDFAFYFMGGCPGSIYLVWSVSNHAVRFLAVAAMNSEFLRYHSVEEVTVDGVGLEEYKCKHYRYHLPFTVISQLRVDELSEGLIWASGEGCLEDVVFLLSTGVEANSRGQWEGRTALMEASEGGYLDVMKELLRAQAGVDLQDEDGWTALILASFNGKADAVQLLLSGGAKVDLQTEDGWTALIWASFNGKADAVQELLSGGAKVDLQNENGWTALMWASFNGKADAVRELLSGGAKVDLQDEYGWTALLLASYNDHPDTVQELLSGEAQVDLQDKDGLTALIRASLEGYPDVVRVLLSAGAQVDLQNEDGQTALICAVQDNYTEIVKVLLAAGAGVNLQEKTSGRSAVFYGAEKGDLEIVKLLIEGGANLSLKDKDGVTADEVAEVHGHHEVCEELRKHMHGGRRPLSKTVHDRVLATGQLLRALYKRLEERILRTQKKQLAGSTQSLDPEIPLPNTHRIKGIRELGQQEEYVLSHLH